MIVRAVKAVDLVLAGFFGSVGLLLMSYAFNPYAYSATCHGRNAWMCGLIDAAKPYEIFGLNPIGLVLALLSCYFAVFALIRLTLGWTAKITDDEVLVLSPIGIKRLPIQQTTSVEIDRRLFGLAGQLTFHLIDGRRYFAANAVLSDAHRLRDLISSNPPASPAIPPAT